MKKCAQPKISIRLVFVCLSFVVALAPTCFIPSVCSNAMRDVQIVESIIWKDLGDFACSLYGCLVKCIFELQQVHHSWSNRGNRLTTRFFYSFTFFLYFSRFYFDLRYIASYRFVAIRFVSFTTLRICVILYVGSSCTYIWTFGVSKCVNAFDFNRLNSTLRWSVSQQYNCEKKSKIIRKYYSFICDSK